uniref:Histone-lysine N-methyltransferase n=1 Tax=Panagrellus redivivus TaxID=6233 RepID=A0A7E4VCF3_PANRE
MPIKNGGAIVLTCSSCKKHTHKSCVASIVSKDSEYMCLSCRKNTPSTSSSVQDDLVNNCNDIEIELESRSKRQTLSTSTSNASVVSPTTPSSSGNNSTGSTPNARKSSYPPTKYCTPPVINTDFETDTLPAQLPTGSSFTSSLDEDMSISNSDDRSEGSSPSGDITADNSMRNSPSLPLESAPTSENDDSRPSSSKRQYKDLNGTKPKLDDGTKEKKKPGRKSNMKTRSGGQPPTNSYAQLGKSAKGRRPTAKGKGKAPKTRRPRTSNKLTYIQAITATIRRESDETNDDDPSTRQPDENDYIRTAIVNSVENPFICNAPMCLICGSIGRDVEGTMMNCMSCSQTYHSYCVNMHEKLNKRILKRGWRCLQCTVCETCGDGSDESNLLLCDECDVAFHTYCLEPKLDKIPSGSWRCHWCATCRRCNKQVQSQSDLQKLDGLCEGCYSMRKCPKCLKLYEAGEMMIRCQHCSRWFHGACEDLLSEDALENAYENAFRCSLCRPRAHTDYNDLMNSSVIVDNVMINKTALPMLNCGRSASSLGGLMDISGSFRSQSTDQTDPDDYMEEIDIGKKKGTGPGRRQPKYGIGGFFVKNRSRIAQSTEDDPDEAVDEKPANGKAKRRPRKPRRHQLEDAYPQALQSAFWGGTGFDGKGLIDKEIDEPILEEAPIPLGPDRRQRRAYELSEDACEFIRSQQEQEMLGDVFGADCENLDIDMDNFDFTGLFGEDDDDMVDDDAPTNENTQDSHSTSATGDRPNSQSMTDSAQRKADKQKNKKNADDRGNLLAWELDEPLGDKATKAAVLFANVTYPDLKSKYPNWRDRHRQIHRIWRTLDSEKRQQYVSLARENKKASRFLGQKQQRPMLPPPSQQQPQAGPSNAGDRDLKDAKKEPLEVKIEPPTERQSEVKTSSQHVAEIIAKINNSQAAAAANSTPPKQAAPLPPPKVEPRSEVSTPVDVKPYGTDSLLFETPIKSETATPNATLSPISSISNNLPSLSLAQRSMGSSVLHMNGGLLSNNGESGSNVSLFQSYSSSVVGNGSPLPGPPKAPIEAIQQYDQLKKDLEDIKDKLAKVEGDVATLRKNKKSIHARRRQLNKNPRVDDNGAPVVIPLNEADEKKLDNINKSLGDRTHAKDLLSKKSKELNAKIDELITKYGPLAPTTPIQQSVPPFPSRSGFSNHLADLRNDRDNYERASSVLEGIMGFGLTNGGGSPLRRADSWASLASESSEVSSDQPKSTRGRKRKKNVEPNKLPAILGGIVYESLTNQVDRDVYELVDYMLYQVVHDGEDPATLSRAPSASMSRSPDSEPKRKKRNTNKKAMPVNAQNEYVTVISEIKESLTKLPPIPPMVLNPFPALDPKVGITVDTTKLLDLVEKPPPEGTKFGFINLDFINDYYGEFEECCLAPPETPDLQIRCSDIYADVQFTDFYEDESDEVYVDARAEPYHTLDFESEVPREELEQLSCNAMAERESGEYIIPQLHPWPDVESCPTDPPRTAYKWKDVDEAVEMDLVLYHDEDVETAAAFHELAEILDLSGKDLDYEVVECLTSPAPESCPDVGDNGEVHCHNCKILIEGDGFEVEEVDPYPHYVIYCSATCYEDAAAQEQATLLAAALLGSKRRIDTPLTIEIADDVTTENKDPQLPTPEHNEAPLTDTDQLIIMEQLRQSRWEEFSVSDLPPPRITTNEITPGGSRAYKFRGQGWTICDEKLLSSFRAAPDDTHEVIRKHSHTWMQYRSSDNRICTLCNELGDGLPALTGRLLNCDANEWIHVNCAVWSTEVHESESGGLNNVQAAIEQARDTYCVVCDTTGASIKCIKLECDSWYHLPCAFKTGCKFMKDITMTCPVHCQNVHPEVNVSRLEALRRVYVEREENALLAKIYNHPFSSDMIMRVGNLVFYHIGQLLPDQLKTFHNNKLIFPNNYRIVRFFWHPTQIHERIGYECTVEDKNNTPIFRVAFEGREIRDTTPHGAWQRILNAIHQSREKTNSVLRFFPGQVNGEDLFGFTEIAITKMTESLPGVDSLKTYEFRHGGAPLMEVPLAINPTGCARTEPCFRTLIKSKKTYFVSPSKNDERPDSREENITGKRRRRRPATDFSGVYDEDTLRLLKASGISEEMLASGNTRNEPAGYATGQLYTRYKNMKVEWRAFVSLGRSGIAGFGLYAKRDIDMNQMVIEYVGEVIRSEICEIREKMYSQKNKGIYMFRIDSDYVIDATMSGNLARYINHSCDPNCYTQIVTIDNDKKIVIFAGRPIKAGEELTYDYQFELEDTEDKIPCLCGAPNCVKWMN